MLQKLLAPLVLLSSLFLLGACDRHAGTSSRPNVPIAGAPPGAAPRSPEACADHYLEGRAPQIQNPKLAQATRELCFNAFSVMHSGVTRTPLWSAEHLDAREVAASQELGRKNAFHAEKRLDAGQRAELSDYARSGFDRGHMTPSDDMPDPDSQRDSFSLANMVPQNHENNTRTWVGIERVVRKMAQKEGDLYVVTGPAYLGTNLRKVGNVLVPTHLYKLVYSPRQKAGAAWFVENTADATPTVIPIPELERIIGINLLPALTEEEKERMLKLPNIRQKKGERRDS